MHSHREIPPSWRLPQHGTYFLLGMLLAILAVIGAAVYLLLRPFERRIYALADVAHEFGGGNLHARARTERDDAIGKLAIAFNQMAGRIERFIERQRELLRAVSHEFRTPLARLFFLVDGAQEASTPEEKDRALKRIENSLQELNDLVEELLTFARLEDADRPPDPEPVDLNVLFREISVVAADLRGEIELSFQCGESEASAVPYLLRRALLNLVTNAIRHARTRIELSCERQGNLLLIHVDDDGPGVPPEVRERIFEPFFRIDQSRTSDSGGTGLGLAIVQRIAALHGGQVQVEDSPLGGARFTLLLPRKP